MTNTIIVRRGFIGDRKVVEFNFTRKNYNQMFNELELRRPNETKKPEVQICITNGDTVRWEDQYGELIDIVDTQWADFAQKNGELSKRGYEYNPQNRAIRPIDGFIKRTI